MGSTGTAPLVSMVRGPGSPAGAIFSVLAALVVAIAPGSRAGAEPKASLGLTTPTSLRPAPDFALTTPGGPTLRLADYRGHVVLLNFWATWCPPCRAEMPGLERLYLRFKDRGFVALGVSVDAAGPPAVLAFQTEHGLTFPIALDPTMTVAARYRVRGLPATFLLDRRGRIRAIWVGAREWDAPDAAGVIWSLLEEAADAPGDGTAPAPVHPTPPGAE